MAGEFDLIARYFNWSASGKGVELGVGDDAALVSLKPRHQLAVSVDTLVPGVHFPLDTHPADIAYKALTVNVSDMAAMGAEPRWFTLALTLSEYDNTWLEAFSQGLKQAAKQYSVDLIGGDTTRGPQTISIQIMGEVEQGKALTRAGAQAGDALFVTSSLGDAAAGLGIHQATANLPVSELLNAQQYCLSRLNRPTARVLESRVIKQFATACIDVSDGLLQDLSHILNASGLGAVIDTDRMPISSRLSALYPYEQCLKYALTGGDDYELLFSIPAAAVDDFQSAMKTAQHACQQIGYVDSGLPALIQDHTGQALASDGFQHF